MWASLQMWLSLPGIQGRVQLETEEARELAIAIYHLTAYLLFTSKILNLNTFLQLNLL